MFLESIERPVKCNGLNKFNQNSRHQVIKWLKRMNGKM